MLNRRRLGLLSPCSVRRLSSPRRYSASLRCLSRLLSFPRLLSLPPAVSPRPPSLPARCSPPPVRSLLSPARCLSPPAVTSVRCLLFLARYCSLPPPSRPIPPPARDPPPLPVSAFAAPQAVGRSLPASDPVRERTRLADRKHKNRKSCWQNGFFSLSLIHLLQTCRVFWSRYGDSMRTVFAT